MRHVSAGLVVLVAGAIFGLSCTGAPLEGPSFAKVDGGFGPTAPLGQVVDKATTAVMVDPVIVTDLQSDSAAAVLGYALAAATQGIGLDPRWELDLTGRSPAADRAAFGLTELGIFFEREGENGNVLVGGGDLLQLLRRAFQSAETQPEVPVALGALVEIGGSPAGMLVATDRQDAREWIAELSNLGGLGTVWRPSGEIWLSSVEDVLQVASFPVTCSDRVPGSGGRGCRRPEPAEMALGVDSWLIATTGPLTPNLGPPLSTQDGGVSWNNNEAQQYGPEGVRLSESIDLIASPNSQPRTDRLPFRSGMIISRSTFGYGTYTAEFVLPRGAGLWPAIWLLDSEACDGPGRCPGYQSAQYHEIDLLEVRGQAPQELVTSVHWWDGSIQTASSAVTVSDLGSGSHTLSLERRPGFLRWSLDGQEVMRVTGVIEGSEALRQGPHRANPVRIVVNLAVGGTFAGDRLVGREGRWWGDARVPQGFPNLDWDEAIFQLRNFAFEPLEDGS